MEIVIGLGCVIVLLIVLGVPLQPIIGVSLWFMEIVAVVCALFFVLMVLLLVLTKKQKAIFLRLEPGERVGCYAIYEVDGKEYRNTFPTDSFTKDWFYKKSEVTIRLRETKRRLFVFDKVTQVIIGIGLPAFISIAVIILVGLSI